MVVILRGQCPALRLMSELSLEKDLRRGHVNLICDLAELLGAIDNEPTPCICRLDQDVMDAVVNDPGCLPE